MPFTVTVIRAFELHDTEFIGEQKVFAQVTIGMDRRRTEDRHGTHPHFNDTFVFEGPPQGQHLEIELWSHHMTGPRLVGRGRFPLAEAEMAGAITTVIQLFEENGRAKGQLEINVAFSPGFMQAAPVAVAMAPAPYMQQPMYAQPPIVVEQPVVVEQAGMGMGMGYGRDPFLAEAVAINDIERREFDNQIRYDERREFDREVRRDERIDFDRDMRRDEFGREMRHEERRDFERRW